MFRWSKALASVEWMSLGLRDLINPLLVIVRESEESVRVCVQHELGTPFFF